MKSSSKNEAGINGYRDLVEFLDLTTDREGAFRAYGTQLTDQELKHRRGFAANFLLLLRAQGRVASASVESCNRVMERWVDILRSSNLRSQEQENRNVAVREPPASIEMIAFYIALGLLGRDAQIEAYHPYMIYIRDDSLQS